MNKQTETTEYFENKITPKDLEEYFLKWKTSHFENEALKLQHIQHLFRTTLELATTQEGILFPTLFSRLAYTGQKFKLNTRFLYLAHAFRRCVDATHISTIDKISLGEFVLSQLLHKIWPEEVSVKPGKLSLHLKDVFAKKNKDVIAFSPVMHGLLISLDSENFTFEFIHDEEGDTIKTVHWNISDKNEIFNENLIEIKQLSAIPITVNLLEVEVNNDGELFPNGIVIQPDFLIDATAIAECFKENGSYPLLYILNKLRPPGVKTPILLGNISNYLLDRLFLDHTVSLQSLTPDIFQKFGLALSVLDDDQMKDVWSSVQTHFSNIRNTIINEFKEVGLYKEKSYLEPSFYSNIFGIQGRLDLWMDDPDRQEMSIVELKSGSVFRPNVYGINASHFIQTQIYEMLLRSAFTNKPKFIKNYILYSKEQSKNLRYAPFLKIQQWEILRIRNSIVIQEEKIKRLPESPGFIKSLAENQYDYLQGFNAKNLNFFQEKFKQLFSVEQKYLLHFLSFIAKEYSLSKIGVHGIENSRGLAALWLESTTEKRERNAILTHLNLISDQSEANEPLLIFENTDTTQISNFRQGDIVILYPQNDETKNPLQQQLYKCSISSIQGKNIVLKLRNTQFNKTFFTQHLLWCIEEDVLDSSFHKLNESLVEYMESTADYRQLLLGQRPPALPKSDFYYVQDETLTPEQNKIVHQAISSNEMFLIWGPPGTGKTSTVLKKITEVLLASTQENILILAYTNRAVDEICEAIAEIPGIIQNVFARIGSKTGTADNFHPYLLDNKLQSCKNRKDVVDLIDHHRVFTGTVSSILGKQELFSLKSFDTVIIDEASQILEPYLCGLLQRFSRRILIGDHKQLPAVVQQDYFSTKIEDQELIQAGLHSLSNSLFERLYQTYKNKGWNQGVGILTYQGRMHPDIQEFVNLHFYENLLKPLGEIKPAYYKNNHGLIIGKEENPGRVIFVHTASPGQHFGKTNQGEAEICARLINKLKTQYEKGGKTITPDTLGVITPFRAQINLIQASLAQYNPELSEIITIDTVERYQGGARDIIIISSCIHTKEQFNRVSSFDDQGVDRKLNVALTRARAQIILIGNKEVLSTQELYRSWINHAVNFDASKI